MKKILLILASASLALVSCKKEEVTAEKPYLNISQESPVVSSSASTFKVGVRANNDWGCSVSMGEDWLSAAQNGDSIVVNVAANSVYDNRMGAVRITSGKLTKVISVTQMAFPNPDRIGVEPASLEFTAERGSKDVTVTANCDWSATVSDPSWLSISSNSGQTMTITVSVSENELDEERNATVVFRKGKKSATLTVSQSAAAPFRPEPGLLAEWNFTESDDNYLKSHNPQWDYNNPNINTDWLLVAEDNVNTAHWVLGSTADRPDFTPRSAISKGIAFNGQWTDDGLQFSVKDVNAAKGMKISFACGLKTGNKTAPAKWGIKFSTDGGVSWTEGDTKLYYKDGTLIEYITDKTNKVQHDILSSITLEKNVRKAHLIVYLYCKDGTIQLGGSARTTAVSTMRFCPATVKAQTIGAEINLEPASEQ